MNKYEALKKYFGYDSFRQGQETIIDAILSEQDALAVMPTGAGKSLCYQIPALLFPGITLVISPLISLMKDQVQALNQAGIHAAYINSSLTEIQIEKALLFAAEGRYKIIYAAPERLETAGFLDFARQVEISMVTVDEAHCISQWGQDFRPSYLKIVQFIRELQCRPVISAFTATATKNVQEDIVCVLGLHNPEVLVSGFDRENLYFSVETPAKKDAFVLRYVREHEGESGIIYCATRKNVDQLYEKLFREGLPVTRYHAGLGNVERRENQESFIYDTAPIMIATNAFGMGIDKSNVRYVLHYNMPQSLENYYQEAGRAGRDNERAECILLYSPQDLIINRFLLDSKEENASFTMQENEAVRQRDEERLLAMQYYCLTGNCLRNYILRYFGEQGMTNCGNCSNCLQETEQMDMTEKARKIIACIQETGGRYGINVVAGTLAGATRDKLLAYGMDSYGSYGSLQDMPEPEIKRLINQMLADGILSVTKDKYTLLRLSDGVGEVMAGTRNVMMKKPKQEKLQPSSGSDSKLTSFSESDGKQLHGSPAMEAENSHNNPERGRVLRRSDILNSKGLELFDKLRGLRMEIAKEESVPPYIVFSDKTLTEFCIRLPFDRQEMLSVSGVGEYKYEQYGERFLDKIKEFTGGVKEKYYFGELADDMDSASPMYSGFGKKRPKKADFYLTPEQIEEFPYAEKYTAAELGAAMSGLRDSEVMKKTSGAEILRRAESAGYVTETQQDGVWHKNVTEKGAVAGLSSETRISQRGTEYEIISFDEKAQRMVLGWFVP